MTSKIQNRRMKSIVHALDANRAIRGLKNLRNAIIDRRFRSRGHDAIEPFLAALPGRSQERICFTIAFNAPWVIDILAAAWARHCPHTPLAVIDNSSSSAARLDIERICVQRGLPYLALPSNPEWSPNRSHGIAMNWVYYNLVRRFGPDTFGFVDHDCFPIRPADPMAALTDKTVRGRHQAGRRDEWTLWAGFCFFRTEATQNLAMDFKHRIEFGLDTGGGNWEALYRQLSPRDVEAVSVGQIMFPVGDDPSPLRLVDGSFVHLGGASYRQRYDKAAFRSALAAYIWHRHLPDDRPVLALP